MSSDLRNTLNKAARLRSFKHPAVIVAVMGFICGAIWPPLGLICLSGFLWYVGESWALQWARCPECNTYMFNPIHRWLPTFVPTNMLGWKCYKCGFSSMDLPEYEHLKPKKHTEEWKH